jgi:Fur family ferric uptake transcriptional regulator
MSHHTWNYQEALRRAGYRVTPQRELIMDLVCAADERLTAQQLCEAARARSPGLNPATVYRNLRFLTDQRLLRAVEREGGTRYELAGPEASHHHLACRSCGRELEIDEAATDAFYAQLERAYGFRVEEDHLVLRGLCAACRDAG